MTSTTFARCTLFLTAAIAASSFSPSASVAQVPKEKAPLLGRWFVVAAEESGKALPRSEWVQTAWSFGEKKAAVTVRGVAGGADEMLTFNYTQDATATPPRLGLYTDEGGAGFSCIYRIERDAKGAVLTICFNPGARAPRPTEFKTTREDTFTLITLRRDP